MRFPRAKRLGLALAAIVVTAAVAVAASGFVTPESPMMAGQNGWTVNALFTVGESVGGYTPTGIFDGLGAVRLSKNTVRIVVNSELGESAGYAYSLANGTLLTGARIHYFDVDRKDRSIQAAGLAYDTIHDRTGTVVTSAAQINQTGSATNGFARFCSAQLVLGGSYGFEDDIFFTGEESTPPFLPHGGTLWALDVANRTLWACPDLGRGGWESVTPVDTGCRDTIAVLMGDDTQGAPLYLYVGTKQKHGSFLERNGLVGGQVYVWKADDGDLDPQTFHGAGSVRTGRFVAVDVRDAGHAGHAGYDDQGYLDSNTLQAAADAVGAFSFSRPEDLATNPADGSQVVFNSTGRGSAYPADNWGTTYVVDTAFPRTCGSGTIYGDLTVLSDSDGLAIPDDGVRSPDNAAWADNGYVYVQEDRSTSPDALFGAVTGREASIWQIDPDTGALEQVAEMDRTVIAPAGTTDIGAGEIGHWESSGVIDVTGFFQTQQGETLLMATVQAHGIRDGAIGGRSNLVEGGQLLLISKRFERAGKAHRRGTRERCDD